MSHFNPQTLPHDIILYITDRLTSLRDLSALTATNHAFDALLSRVLCRHGMRLDPELFLKMCGQGGSRTGTVARLLAAGADPSVQHLSANSRSYTGIVGVGKLETPGHFDSTLRYGSRTRRGSDSVQKDPDLVQAGWELGARDDAICVRSRTAEEVRQAIVDASHDPDDWHVSWSAIHVAAARGHVGVLKLLITHQKDLVNSLAPGYGKIGKYEPSIRLRQEFIHLNEERMRRILEWGSWPQAILWSMHTPLRAALCARQEDAARFLIDNGADLDFTHPENSACHEHALHMAARYGCIETIKYLCSSHPKLLVDINIRDSDGWTPLCQAIASPISNVDTITTLLSLGADVNANLTDPKGKVDNNGMTHLHLACWRRNWPRALLLLHAGADVHAIWTPNPATLPETYDSHGPWRAIDLVCMETFKDSSTPQPHPGRIEVLRRLVQDHGADTGPCTGAKHSTLAIAATNPGKAEEFEIGPLEMLNALRDAGVYFHTDGWVIEKAFARPGRLHVNKRFMRPRTTIAVVAWLAKHGAHVDPKRPEVVFAGIMKALEYAAEKKFEEKGLVEELGEMIRMLVKRGGMDPNITSVEHGVAEDGRPCSLFQAALKIQDVPVHKAMSRVMEEVGARPPGLLVALREFRMMLPRMEEWQVREVEVEEKPDEEYVDGEEGKEEEGDEQWEGRVAERPADLGGVIEISDDEEVAEAGHNKEADHESVSSFQRRLQQRKDEDNERYHRSGMEVALRSLREIFCRTVDHVLKDPSDREIPTVEVFELELFQPFIGRSEDRRANRRAESQVRQYQVKAARHLESWLGGYLEVMNRNDRAASEEHPDLRGFIQCTRMADYRSDRTLKKLERRRRVGF